MTKCNFTLVGPHAGETITLGTYKFIDGVFAFEGSDADILILTRVLREQYQAFGPNELEDAKKAYEGAKVEALLYTSLETTTETEIDIKNKFVAKRMIAEKLDPEDLYGKGAMADKVRADMNILIGEKTYKKKKKEEIIEQIKTGLQPVKIVEPTKVSENSKLVSAIEPTKVSENSKQVRAVAIEPTKVSGNNTNSGAKITTTESEKIIDALNSLDVSNDEHWTLRGVPNIDVVSKILENNITRVEIETAAPNFTREVAKASKIAETTTE